MLGEFLNAVSAVVVLLMLMAVGYFMGTKGWMKAEEKKFLSKYIINIAVPCNCINGLLNNLDQSMLAQAGLMLVSAIIGVVITILLGMGLATLLRLPKNRWGCLDPPVPHRAQGHSTAAPFIHAAGTGADFPYHGSGNERVYHGDHQ